MKMNDDEWWWMMVNDEWGCWCIMIYESIVYNGWSWSYCILFLLYIICISVRPHSIYSDFLRWHRGIAICDVWIHCQEARQDKNWSSKATDQKIALRQSVVALACSIGIFLYVSCLIQSQWNRDRSGDAKSKMEESSEVEIFCGICQLPFNFNQAAHFLREVVVSGFCVKKQDAILRWSLKARLWQKLQSKSNSPPRTTFCCKQNVAAG